MKKTSLSLALAIFASSVLLLSVAACRKHRMLNIDYPALYVANGGSANISVIRLSDNTVTETIDLNGAKFPHHLYINPAKTKLAVAITGVDLSGGHAGHGGAASGLRIQIIDAVSGMIEKEIPLSKMPHNAIFNSAGTELWLGQMDTVQSQVLVYNTSDWSLKSTINVGKGLSEVTFSADASMAFACNTINGTVSLIDANSKVLLSTLVVGQDPVGAWPASNGNMYVDNEASQTISEISVSGMNVIATINLGFKPGYVAYHINGELWVSDATNGQIAYFRLISNVWTLQGTITTGADAHAILFSLDGSLAYVSNQGANTISVIEVSTHLLTKTINVNVAPNGMAIKN